MADIPFYEDAAPIADAMPSLLSQKGSKNGNLSCAISFGYELLKAIGEYGMGGKWGFGAALIVVAVAASASSPQAV